MKVLENYKIFSVADGWTTADLVYIWKEIDPVQIVKDLNLPRFKLEQFQTTYCNTITNTGQSRPDLTRSPHNPKNLPHKNLPHNPKRSRQGAKNKVP